ncbi:NAD(P)-binding protein [Trichoderma longibrachiatum ATCC 18648]|uniref:NAD(P)-binding protein n=1 Tax=Trichoderma longibrachiatum ATCC 18648 TaxID=983965 RepID=A0A2T4C2C1_TRILO|nr:NAD(P)-binding protein [Trichoderma longibrachiatum ATCC 18648]
MASTEEPKFEGWVGLDKDAAKGNMVWQTYDVKPWEETDIDIKIHFGILFAKAMGADRVVAVSRRSDKRADALALGADEYIATAEDEDWATKHARTLDLIVCSISSSNMPLTEYIGLLKRDGVFVQLGLPDDGQFKVGAAPFAFGRRSLTGSLMGSPHEIREMLQLAADKGIKPWVELWPMSEANKAIVEMDAGKAKYRYVLVNNE